MNIYYHKLQKGIKIKTRNCLECNKNFDSDGLYRCPDCHEIEDRYYRNHGADNVKVYHYRFNHNKSIGEWR